MIERYDRDAPNFNFGAVTKETMLLVYGVLSQQEEAL